MSGWISCRDRLPPENKSVWVSGYDVCRYVTIAIRDSGVVSYGDELSCDGDGDRNPVYGVTHWMPFEMPEPPVDAETTEKQRGKIAQLRGACRAALSICDECTGRGFYADKLTTVLENALSAETE